MSDLKAFAERLVSLRCKDVQQLAEILKEEYGIKPKQGAKLEDLCVSEKAVSRQVRRKMEREAKKKRK